MSCCGINSTVIKLYHRLGYITGAMEHYYKLNNCTHYRIAIINDRAAISASIVCGDAKLVNFYNYSDLAKRFDPERYNNRNPYKDAWYLNWRYFDHYKYQYLVFGIDKGKQEIDSLLIGREIECNGAKVLRIVDFIGLDTDLQLTRCAFDQLLENFKYEYIDFYQYGIPESIMNKAGFILKTKESLNIIPNYFEPFEQRNIEILFFHEKCDDFHIYKADGDQDRPNSI
jgi:hypothetical protein